MHRSSLIPSVSKHRTSYTFGDVGGGTGGDAGEAPRLSNQFISVGMRGMELLHDQSRDASIHLMAVPVSGKSPGAHLLSQIHCLQVSSSHVNLLPPSTVPLHAFPAEDIPENIILPIAGLDAGKGIPDFQTDIAYEYSGVSTNPLLSSLNNSSASDIGTSRENQFMRVPNDTNIEAAYDFSKALYSVESDDLREDIVASTIAYMRVHAKGDLSCTYKNGENQILAQSHTSTKRKLDEVSYNVAEPHSTVTVAMPGFPSRQARTQNGMNSQLRRSKIAEGIKALQNIVPCPSKGNKETAMDDVIDYIKFLKLKIKALSQSHLCGEATPYPFVHLEGYGHYLLHQQMSSEPLEEMMGQLMESNMQAANELLESKKLTILPMALAYTLLQTS